jgi:hypothetical protein
LSVKISISEVALVIIPILEVEDPLPLKLVVLPFALISVAILVEDCPIAFFKPTVKVAFVSIPIARDEHSSAVKLAGVPLPIINRPSRKEHSTLATLLVIDPVTIVNGAVVVVVDTSAVPHDLANILSPIKVVQLIYRVIRDHLLLTLCVESYIDATIPSISSLFISFLAINSY